MRFLGLRRIPGSPKQVYVRRFVFPGTCSTLHGREDIMTQ